jgi:capsule polysaccharide export protein KpsE/RkpR
MLPGMNRPVTIAAVVAILIGLLAGYLWWGLPTGKLQSELQTARAAADRVQPQIEELRAKNRALEEQLKGQKAQLESLEGDLKREKEMNERLQTLVSHGKK